jgi:hypothetical protein
MSGTLILLQLGGYVGLLLWGTHMVTTGIERGFGTELRLWLGKGLSRPGRSARFYALLAGLQSRPPPAPRTTAIFCVSCATCAASTRISRP